MSGPTPARDRADASCAPVRGAPRVVRAARGVPAASRMPRRPATVAPPPVLRAPQLELFPDPPQIEGLDPRRVGGAGTRVQGVWMVRYRGERAGHRVFHDRHGWYCDVHGARCPAVADAQGFAGPLGRSGPPGPLDYLSPETIDLFEAAG